MAQEISSYQKFVKVLEKKDFINIIEENNIIYLSFDKNKNILSKNVLDTIHDCLTEKGFSYSEVKGFYVTDAKIVADKLYIKKAESGEYFSIEDVAKACWNRYVADRPISVFPIFDSIDIFGELERERRENNLEISQPISFDLFGFPQEMKAIHGRFWLLLTNGSIKCPSQCFIGRLIELDRNDIKIKNGTVSFEKGKSKEMSNYYGNILYYLPRTRLKIYLNKEGVLELSYPQKYHIRFKPNENQDVPLFISYQRETMTYIKFNEIEKQISFSIQNLINNKKETFSITSDVGLEIRIDHDSNIIYLEGPSFSLDNKLYTSSNVVEIDLNKDFKLKTSMRIGEETLDTGLTYNKETDTHQVNFREFGKGSSLPKGDKTCALISGGRTRINVVSGSENLLGLSLTILGLDKDSTAIQVTDILKSKVIQGIVDEGLKICDNAVISNIENLDARGVYRYIKEPIKNLYIRDRVKKEVEDLIKREEIAGVSSSEKDNIIEILTEEAANVLGEEIGKKEVEAKKYAIDFYSALRKNDQQGMINAKNNLISLVDKESAIQAIRNRINEKVKNDPSIKKAASPLKTLVNKLVPFVRIFN